MLDNPLWISNTRNILINMEAVQRISQINAPPLPSIIESVKVEDAADVQVRLDQLLQSKHDGWVSSVRDDHTPLNASPSAQISNHLGQNQLKQQLLTAIEVAHGDEGELKIIDSTTMSGKKRKGEPRDGVTKGKRRKGAVGGQQYCFEFAERGSCRFGSMCKWVRRESCRMAHSFV